MTELIILEELGYGMQKEVVEPYKTIVENPETFQRFLSHLCPGMTISDKEYLEDFALQAEFVAFQKCLEDHVPIAFYKRDECFTRKAFEQRNYLCTIAPHERARRLCFSEEQKSSQKQTHDLNYKVFYTYNENSHVKNYSRRGASLDSRIDFTIDPHDYSEIKDPVERYKNYNAVKQYWAHVGFHHIPRFAELHALIQKQKWSLDSWWESELYFGKSKAACIHHIAKHFGDYSLWQIMENKKTLQSWLKVHGCSVKL